VAQHRARVQTGRRAELTREFSFLSVEAADDPVHLRRRGKFGKHTAWVGVAIDGFGMEVDRALPPDINLEFFAVDFNRS